MPDTETLTPDQLTEIEKCANAATEGPWISPANKQPWPDEAAFLESIVCADGGYVNRRNWKQVCLNMDFISRAREDVPALCRSLRAAWANELRLAQEVVTLRTQNQTQAESIIEFQENEKSLKEQLAHVEQERDEARRAHADAEEDLASARLRIGEFQERSKR